jgi:hypothetical protein
VLPAEPREHLLEGERGPVVVDRDDLTVEDTGTSTVASTNATTSGSAFVTSSMLRE